MEPETPTPHGSNKKFLITSLVVGLMVLAGGALFFIKNQSRQQGEGAPLPIIKKDFTSEEKMKILSELTASIPAQVTSTQKEKMRILESIAKKIPVSTASSTAEKMKILQALASSTGQ